MESTCLGILYFDTMRLTAVAVVYEYVSTETCAPSALFLVSRPKPVPADSSLATERCVAHRLRVGREGTSAYTCVTMQLIDRSAVAFCHIEFRCHAFIRFDKLMAQVVGVWAII